MATGTETEMQPLFPVEEDQVFSVDSSERRQEFSKKSEPDKPKRIRCLCPRLREKVTGSCLCKLSIVFYLLVCVALSVVYVGLRYEHEPDVEDQPSPWIPGTVMLV